MKVVKHLVAALKRFAKEHDSVTVRAVFITGFIIIGVIATLATHAAGQFTSFEAEGGNRTGNVSVGSDNAASNNSYIKFGGSSKPTDLTDFFPIGAYVQINNMAAWKARGINTMVEVPQNNSQTAWDAEAAQNGLYTIRAQGSNVAADKTNPNLLAWTQQDEPDGINSQVPYTTIQSRYNAMKAADPNRLVWINFVGDLNQFDLNTGESGIAWYQKYAAGADWISSDTYPINNGTPISKIGTEVDTLRQIAGNKPVFVFIESSDYDQTSGSGPITPDQLRSEIWQAIIHGAKGIWYFPIRLNPSFQFDATPANVAAEMTTQHAIITPLASVIQSTRNPSGISASVSSPLQVSWRNFGGHSYFFVLNQSSGTVTGQQIHLTGTGSASTATVLNESRNEPISGGTITDDFAAYAVHIYQVN